MRLANGGVWFDEAPHATNMAEFLRHYEGELPLKDLVDGWLQVLRHMALMPGRAGQPLLSPALYKSGGESAALAAQREAKAREAAAKGQLFAYQNVKGRSVVAVCMPMGCREPKPLPCAHPENVLALAARPSPAGGVASLVGEEGKGLTPGGAVMLAPCGRFQTALRFVMLDTAGGPALRADNAALLSRAAGLCRAGLLLLSTAAFDTPDEQPTPAHPQPTDDQLEKCAWLPGATWLPLAGGRLWVPVPDTVFRMLLLSFDFGLPTADKAQEACGSECCIGC